MATYMNDNIRAAIGDVVLTRGDVRGIVIAVKDSFITVLGIGTDPKTDRTFVLTPRFIHDCPASECHYMKNQNLNLWALESESVESN